MKNLLENIKKQLTDKYLGKVGIHGVGISKAKKTVKIYYDSEVSGEVSEVFKKIEEEAQPYNIEKIASNRASLL